MAGLTIGGPARDTCAPLRRVLDTEAVIAIATRGDTYIARKADDVLYIPSTLDCLQPLLAVVPFQLLAYHIAVRRKCDVDKPRNLAKSVTVE